MFTVSFGGTKSLGVQKSDGVDVVTMCWAGPCSEHLMELCVFLFTVGELKQVAFKGPIQF